MEPLSTSHLHRKSASFSVKKDANKEYPGTKLYHIFPGPILIGIMLISFFNPTFSLAEFYPFYLCEHFQPKTKLFHFLGLFNAVILIFIFFVYNRNPKTILFAFLQGYLFAWVSHAFVEVNKPATFTYPAYSFASDWIMFKDLWLGSLTMW